MKSLTAITIISVAVMIMASAGYYFYNNSINESSYPSYHVDMHLNATNLTSYYPIHVNSNLTGNGTYQQLLTISDPSHYGINANGSNLAFYDGSNNTHLYAWIQSMNNTSMQIWVKNYNASNIIDMQVLPSYKDLFNATGYLGKQGTSTNNGIMVFPYFVYFYGNTVYQSSIGGLSYTGTLTNNSLKIKDNNTDSMTINNNVLSNFNSTFIFGENYDTGTSSNSISQGSSSGGLYLGSGFFGDNQYAVNWYNGLTNPYLYFYASNGQGGLNPYPALTNMFENYMVNFYHSNIGYLYGYYYVNNTYDIYMYYNSSRAVSAAYTLSNPFFWFTQQTSVAYSEYSYIAIMNGIGNNSMPTFTIGTFTNMTDHADASYLSNSITIPMPNWFNLTLKAYTNYSFTFHYNNTPLYFTYDGLINNTIYTGFLDSNLTLDIHFIALGYSGKTKLIVVGEKT